MHHNYIFAFNASRYVWILFYIGVLYWENKNLNKLTENINTTKHIRFLPKRVISFFKRKVFLTVNINKKLKF